MIKKIIGIIICMLLVLTILPVSADVFVNQKYKFIIYSNTLYVGGIGSNNYTKIQDAIDDAVDGDTIFVFNDSSPYYESLVVNKSITLFGEDKYSTIIDSDNEKFCIYITKEFVSISGFTIKNKINGLTGITIKGSNCINIVISNNIIKNTNRGIFIEGGCRNHIDANIIMDIIVGIDIKHYANGNIISNNTIVRFDYIGIEITEFSNYNTVTGNVLNGTGVGIELYDSDENDIFLNAVTEIKNNDILFIVNSFNNKINKNNFINNRFNFVFSIDSNNKWNGNYWGKSRILPKFIFVIKHISSFGWIPDFDIDWHPAKEPYNI